MSDSLRGKLIVLISLVWAANFTAPIFVRDYIAPPEVHLIFMAVVGGLIATTKKPPKDDDD